MHRESVQKSFGPRVQIPLKKTVFKYHSVNSVTSKNQSIYIFIYIQNLVSASDTSNFNLDDDLYLPQVAILRFRNISNFVFRKHLTMTRYWIPWHNYFR